MASSGCRSNTASPVGGDWSVGAPRVGSVDAIRLPADFALEVALVGELGELSSSPHAYASRARAIGQRDTRRVRLMLGENPFEVEGAVARAPGSGDSITSGRTEKVSK